MKDITTNTDQQPVTPVQPYYWDQDQQLRKEALDDALSIMHHWDNKQKCGAAEIVAEAEIIYAFLSGTNRGFLSKP